MDFGGVVMVILLCAWVGSVIGVVVLGDFVIRLGVRGDRSDGRARCPKCWYDMRGTLPRLVCPECGHDARQEAQLYLDRSRPWLIALGLLIVLGGLLLLGSVLLLPMLGA